MTGTSEQRRIHEEAHPAFGPDRFGQIAEKIARFFGTPQYIIGQTFVVIAWIIFNGFELLIHFDKYPFILLNLGFSLQAAYAAPLILLAQTRQADRDKIHEDAAARHREDLSNNELKMLAENTQLTEQVAKLSKEIDSLTREIHAQLVKTGN
jgi:uncharacterized membrane protein